MSSSTRSSPPALASRLPATVAVWPTNWRCCHPSTARSPARWALSAPSPRAYAVAFVDRATSPFTSGRGIRARQAPHRVAFSTTASGRPSVRMMAVDPPALARPRPDWRRPGWERGYLCGTSSWVGIAQTSQSRDTHEPGRVFCHRVALKSQRRLGRDSSPISIRAG